MALSETAICNDALIEVGAATILSLDDNSPQARLCKHQYPKLRDEMIEGHPWNWSIARASLAASTTAPVYEWARAFPLPNDCLRVLEVENAEEEDWQREGNTIVTNLSTCNIKYISKVTEPGKFSENFSRALALKLAASISFALVQNASLKETLMKAAKEALATARSYDAQEGSPRVPYAKSWLNSRY